MPLTHSSPATAQEICVSKWSEVEPGFWVANHDGSFAGTISSHSPHFFLQNCFGEYLGDYSTLHDAQDRLAEHLV